MNKFLNEAYNEALKALNEKEIPIGAVIVKDGNIISRAYNKREQNNEVSSHAEINAINIAGKELGTWKLEGCELYVTIEPCLMCYGAILQSRIKKVYVGYEQLDFKKTSYRYYLENTDLEIINFNEEKCYQILQEFFKKMR